MKKIENIENINYFGDFIWVHTRGFLFIILTTFLIFATLGMSAHYMIEIDKSKINEIRYCPYCSHDLLN